MQNMFVVRLKPLTFQVDAHCTDLPCSSSALNEIDLYLRLLLHFYLIIRYLFTLGFDSNIVT